MRCPECLSEAVRGRELRDEDPDVGYSVTEQAFVCADCGYEGGADELLDAIEAKSELQIQAAADAAESEEAA